MCESFSYNESLYLETRRLYNYIIDTYTHILWNICVFHLNKKKIHSFQQWLPHYTDNNSTLLTMNICVSDHKYSVDVDYINVQKAFLLLTFQSPFEEFIVEVIRHFQILVSYHSDSIMKKTTHVLLWLSINICIIISSRLFLKSYQM
jgi:hypothetical protein